MVCVWDGLRTHVEVGLRRTYYILAEDLGYVLEKTEDMC